VQTHLPVSSESNNVNAYIRNEGSFYNEEMERRELKDENINYSKIASIVKDYTRKGVKRDIDKMMENGEMLYIKDENVYVILEPQGSWISLDGKFVKELVRTLNSRTNSIYYWLYRRWHQRKREGKPCYFTLGDICNFLNISDQNKNRHEVDKCLAHLVAVGLIQYQIVREGKTYLRKLTYIGTKMRVIDAVANVNKIIEKGADGNSNKVKEEESLITIGYGDETKAVNALSQALLRDFN